MHVSARTALRVLTGLSGLLLGACEFLPWGRPTPTPTPSPAPTVAATVAPRQPLTANPLSGLQVPDPDLLKTPAVLISISHFPATARPQAGLSFAPFVYEFYITEGATRFLAVFHGEWPAPEIPIQGGCESRWGPGSPDGILIGNRAWFDANGDGLQTPGENGIAGMCVTLLDNEGRLVAETTTDTNGYYGFNVEPGHYVIQFVLPTHLRFTQPNAGDDAADSDADPSPGLVAVDVTGEDLLLDAGFVLAEEAQEVQGVDGQLPLA